MRRMPMTDKASGEAPRDHLTEMFTIYRNPSDFAGKYVVRRVCIGPVGFRHDSEPLAVVDTLQEARAAIPPGLYNLGRAVEDDPVIEEVWL